MQQFEHISWASITNQYSEIKKSELSQKNQLGSVGEAQPTGEVAFFSSPQFDQVLIQFIFRPQPLSMTLSPYFVGENS
jgi:hypothetical protein